MRDEPQARSKRVMRDEPQARSKRVMNQTIFDVPDPFVMHLLLLTHEFIFILIASLILGILSVTFHAVYVPKTHR